MTELLIAICIVLIVVGVLTRIVGVKFMMACFIQLLLIFATGFVAYWITQFIGGWLGGDIAWWFTYFVALLILSPISYAIIRKL